jgi:hypothetical protein
VSDLAAALREAGHPEVADQLERRELAARLRESGRPDLADALMTGEQTPPAEAAEPGSEPAPPAPHEQLARSLRNALSRWVTLGRQGAPDGEAG